MFNDWEKYKYPKKPIVSNKRNTANISKNTNNKVSALDFECPLALSSNLSKYYFSSILKVNAQSQKRKMKKGDDVPY